MEAAGVVYRYKVSQLFGICFFADLLRECSPISRLRGHGRPPFCVPIFPSYSGFKDVSEQNYTKKNAT